MWTLKDKELKQKLSTWFTDEEIDSECCQQMYTIESVITLRKGLSPAAGSVVFDVFKNEFELTYNPNGWNPYLKSLLLMKGNGLYRTSTETYLSEIFMQLMALKVVTNGGKTHLLITPKQWLSELYRNLTQEIKNETELV